MPGKTNRYTPGGVPWSYRLGRAGSSRDNSSSQTNEGATSEAQSQEESTPWKTPIFPWRHEDTPLPRLVEGTLDHATKGHLLSSVTVQTGNVQMNALASAFMFLDVPWYQFLFFGSWKGELAESMSWAFTQGVGGLLADLTSQTVPMNNIIKDAYEVKFHTKVGGKTSNAKVDQKDETLVDDNTTIVPLANMLEPKVIEFFQAAKQNITKETEICLKMVPFSAELVSLYAIPYLSRRNTQSDKALLEFYRTMMKKPSMDRSNDLSKLRKEKLETGIMESTVIAQVLIWCNEVFYVKDVDTGKVIQGSDDNDVIRNIPHLVRMESTVKTTKRSDGSFHNIQENWIITDIDDMLDGNLIL